MQVSEDEMIARLQLAVNDMHLHRPQSSIETEVEMWHATLEKEQKAYDESGAPKFKYKWFRKNRYLMVKNHPLYGTRYENHRKSESRLEYFKLGVNIDERFVIMGDEIRFKHFDIYDHTSYSDHWKTDSHTLFATMALICSANSFIRFPMACYANGGSTIGQPLLYFEMAIGQYSLNGPNGFGKLHPYAKGIPYAAAFMCIVFGTAKSVMLAYCMLYPLISLTASTGKCDSIWNRYSNCISYENFEETPEKIWAHRRKDTKSKSVFSTELFFREAVLNSDWETKIPFRNLHWKLVIAYCLVCAIAYIPIHYNLTGRTMKKWLRYCLILPIMVSIVFLHQSFGRGGIYQAAEYFLSIDTQHVSALSLWSESFDLMLGTLGIGYGYHWSISGRTPFSYRNTYKDSWIICGCSMLFGMIGSLVMFLETGIVGELTGDTSHFHVFEERLGISFVCYSGALLKLGRNTSIFVSLFFFVFIIYGMWSQIITADIILRWIEHGHIIRGKVHRVVERKTSSIFIVIGVQLAIISPTKLVFPRKEAASVLDAENIFGGSFAAYTVVLAELVTVVYLYGFARFLVDLEIMIKRPLPVLFQIQIRYVVFPAIGIFIVPMIINVYAVPSIYADRNAIGWIFYVGVAENIAPITILVTFGILGVLAERNQSGNQVHPEPLRYGTYNGMGKRFDPRFVARRDAPSQQSHNRILRSETYYVTEHNMQYIFQAQKVVENEFKKLLNFKRVQARWLHLMLLWISFRHITSFAAAAQRVLLYRKNEYNKLDTEFLVKTLEQIVNFKFYSAMRKLQRMPVNELLPFMVEQLIQLTITHSDEFATSESGSSSSDNSGDQASSDSSDENEIHSLLTGKLDNSPEESRLLMTIRLKKGLGIPYIGELNLLKYLRRERAKRERQRSVWAANDPLPVDQFVPISIYRDDELLLKTVFHAVVVEGNGHFVLKKLPIPRPPTIRVTKKFLKSQPGKYFSQKVTQVVTKRMRRNIPQIVEKRNPEVWSKRKLKRHLWRVADRLDEDVYDFLDRLLTCIIVVLDNNDEFNTLSSQHRRENTYLTQTARRHVPPEEAPQPQLTVYKGEYQMTTYGALTFRQLQQKKWLDTLRRQPADILYHSDGSDGSSVESEELKSSSGSSSSVSLIDNDMDDELSMGSFSSGGGGSISRPSPRLPIAKYMLANETLQVRDKKSLAFKLKVDATPTMPNLWISPHKVKHISSRQWQRNQRKRSVSEPDSDYRPGELYLHGVVDRLAELSIDADKAEEDSDLDSEMIGVRKAISLQSLRYLRDSDIKSVKFNIKQGELVAIPNVDLAKKKQEEKLANDKTTGLKYLSYAKTLVVYEGSLSSDDISIGENSAMQSSWNLGTTEPMDKLNNSLKKDSETISPGRSAKTNLNVPRPTTLTFRKRSRRNSLDLNRMRFS
ncbi:Sodium-dependent serotonin transporter [Orchesella cincta]|uniref:Sodium-dependent serotonin transporter n=1 Tax=Orchesella cincta TaxID=48709 RepID=A0A1D2NHF3_ORCCI|nr:Sodium-dependent serotonin transporter [Orchesella cincta]